MDRYRHSNPRWWTQTIWQITNNNFLFLYFEKEQTLAFDIAVAKAVEVPVEDDQAHILGPSRVWIGIVIQIQDGGPEQFDE